MISMEMRRVAATAALMVEMHGSSSLRFAIVRTLSVNLMPLRFDLRRTAVWKTCVSSVRHLLSPRLVDEQPN